MMRIKRKIYIHIGYPKTATKLLQYNYFPICFSNSSYRDLKDNVKVRTKSDQIIKSIQELDSDILDPYLISCERISLNLSSKYKNQSTEFFDDVISKLSNFTDKFDFIFIVVERPIAELVKSSYLYLIGQGAFITQNAYVEKFSTLDFDLNYRLQKLSKYNCRVFNFNDVVKDPVQFCIEAFDISDSLRLDGLSKLSNKDNRVVNESPKTYLSLVVLYLYYFYIYIFRFSAFGKIYRPGFVVKCVSFFNKGPFKIHTHKINNLLKR